MQGTCTCSILLGQLCVLLFILFHSQTFFDLLHIWLSFSLMFLLCFCYPCFQHIPPQKLHLQWMRRIFSHSFLQRNSSLKTVCRANLYNIVNGWKSEMLPVRHEWQSLRYWQLTCEETPFHWVNLIENSYCACWSVECPTILHLPCHPTVVLALECF